MRELIELNAETALAVEVGKLYCVRNPDTGAYVIMRCEQHEDDRGRYFFTNDNAPSQEEIANHDVASDYSKYFQHIRGIGHYCAKHTRKELSEMMASGQYRIE